MCDARGLTEFALSCIRNIIDLATPELFIVNPSPPRRSSRKEKFKKSIRLNGNLWHIQNRLFPIHDLPAYRSKSLDECFPNVPRLNCEVTRKGKWSEYFSQEDIERIREYRLDFILKFGYGIVRGDVFSTARYGIWSYHHDDEEKYRGGPPAFWEIYSGDPVTGALLQRINETLDGGVVLAKIHVPTIGTSYAANLQRIQESSAHMVRWVCLDILRGDTAALDAPPSKTKAPIYRAPNDLQMLRFWRRIAGNWIRGKLANQRVDDWNIGLVHAAPEEFLDPSFRPRIEWSAYREKHQMVADPCLAPAPEGVRILCEEFSWLSESGRILEIRSAPDGSLSLGKPAIEEAAHMSYPYVLQYQDETYCFPECAQSGRVPLYRWDRDTARWVEEGRMIDGLPAVDATVFQADGAWWLFHTLPEGVGRWSLYIWKADGPFGPWQPHPSNPVKTDVRSSRPAGRPFWYEGKLYRPAQDNANSYGGALVINRIENLSLDEFREVTVRRIAPDASWPYPHGIHTLNGSRGITVIDAKRHRWPPALILKRFCYKLLGRPRKRSFRYPSGGFQMLGNP